MGKRLTILLFMFAIALIGGRRGEAQTVTPLTSGVPVTGLAGAQGGQQYFKITIPWGRPSAVVQIWGGTGDCDLYLRRSLLPTTTAYDRTQDVDGNTEILPLITPAGGTWYIMLRGNRAYSGVTLKATIDGSVTRLSNGSAQSNLNGAQHGQTVYKIAVPAGQAFLECKSWGGAGDADLYLKQGSAPTKTDFDLHYDILGNNEALTVANPATGDWYVMMHGYLDYHGVTLKAAYGTKPVITTLGNNGVKTGLAGSVGSQKVFKLTVPPGRHNSLVFRGWGGTGDADLYVKHGAVPSLIDYDVFPDQAGNSETARIENPAPGDWFVLVYGAAAYSGLSLSGSYGNNVTALQNGVALTGFSGPQHNGRFFKIVVPEGQAKLEVKSWGGTGDADLYLRRGALPSETHYNYFLNKPGNAESIVVTAPTAGTWYVLLHGFANYSGAGLKAQYTPPGLPAPHAP